LSIADMQRKTRKFWENCYVPDLPMVFVMMPLLI